MSGLTCWLISHSSSVCWAGRCRAAVEWQLHQISWIFYHLTAAAWLLHGCCMHHLTAAACTCWCIQPPGTENAQKWAKTTTLGRFLVKHPLKPSLLTICDSCEVAERMLRTDCRFGVTWLPQTENAWQPSESVRWPVKILENADCSTPTRMNTGSEHTADGSMDQQLNIY